MTDHRSTGPPPLEQFEADISLIIDHPRNRELLRGDGERLDLLDRQRSSVEHLRDRDVDRF